MAAQNSGRGLWPLQSLNFFMADMQAGIGPFLGVFLLARGWTTGPIGTVMTIGGVIGMIMTAPAGALVDHTRRKRTMIIVPGICTVLASAIILWTQNFWMVTLSQVMTAVAGAAIGPAIAGITLGIVHQAGFNTQNGRNAAFNHAGNVLGAALSGYLGWKYGFVAVLWLSAAFGVLSIISVLLIPPTVIDHRAARGIKEDNQEGTATGLGVLWRCSPLLIVAAALMLFHLGNAAMLPLYGMAVSVAHQGNPTELVAMTIVVAQSVMVATSLVASRLGERRGYWLVLLVSFLALPVRAVLAAHLINRWGVYPVQVLDGIGAGLQSVAVPGLVARILDGTGRVNVGQGAVATAQALGAALSPALGGWLAQVAGYSTAFLVLGAFALGSLALWIRFAPLLRPASGESKPDRKPAHIKDSGRRPGGLAPSSHRAG
jgi:MFS family permease